MKDVRKLNAWVLALPAILFGLWLGGAALDATPTSASAVQPSSASSHAIENDAASRYAFVVLGADDDPVAMRLAQRAGEFADVPQALTTDDLTHALTLWEKACDAEPTPVNRAARELLADGLQRIDWFVMRDLRLQLNANDAASPAG